VAITHAGNTNPDAEFDQTQDVAAPLRPLTQPGSSKQEAQREAKSAARAKAASDVKLQEVQSRTQYLVDQGAQSQPRYGSKQIRDGDRYLECG